jgi:hypothetical protein
MRQLIGSGTAQLLLDTSIAGAPSAEPGTAWANDFACLESTDILESFLRGLRRNFRDLATLHYPWHPDD